MFCICAGLGGVGSDRNLDERVVSFVLKAHSISVKCDLSEWCIWRERKEGATYYGSGVFLIVTFYYSLRVHTHGMI